MRTARPSPPRPRSRSRPVVLTVGALALVLGATACGRAADLTASPRTGTTVGLLLPDNQTPRFERFDKPLIVKRIKELCSACTVRYASSRHDVATQQQQVDTMITQGADVLILDAVDGKALRASVNAAARAGVPVVAYDRLADGPISGYVTFDGGQVGRLQGEGLLKALGDKAHDGQVVMMNGAETDPNSGWFKDGALSVLHDKVKIARAYDTLGWRPENAHANMSAAIASLGADKIVGVLAANDGLAGGVIAALKSAKVAPLPPVTGQDADLAGIQRIIQGEQYMTVYKPFRLEADAAADMAVRLARGESITNTKTTTDNATNTGIPTVLLRPQSVTAGNVKATVIHDGLYTTYQICSGKYSAACQRLGLVGRR
ncbi:sugar ABC transporter substrate-binding protein [Streptomyces olivochromogenes]|nr:sugar ABC transporter substrate-binding protein [Streptomyces olivochromogenes]